MDMRPERYNQYGSVFLLRVFDINLNEIVRDDKIPCLLKYVLNKNLLYIKFLTNDCSYSIKKKERKKLSMNRI